VSIAGTIGGLAGRLVPSGGVLERTVKSGVWAGLTNVSAQSLQYVRLLVLAALLVPADFGLMGIALLTIAACKQLTELGVTDALIRHEDEDVGPYLDTAWVMNVVRGLVIFAFVFLAAPSIAAFFSEPRATDVLRVVAVVPLLFGLQNPAVVYFRKDLAFHREFGLQLSRSLVDATVAIAFALVYGTVWALVWGVVAGELAMLLVSYAIGDYRPKLRFDWARAREMYAFGKWITGLSILVFLTNQGDDIFVGWLLGAGALGLYQFAYHISNMPTTQVSKIVSSVAFPAYSKLQHDLPRLREAYFRVLKLVAVVAVPTTIGIVLTIEPFVLAFLGEKWLPAVPVLQLLSVWGLVRALGSTSGSLFKARNRPDFTTKIQFGRFLLMAVLIWPATDAYGVLGTAAVVVGTALVFSEPAVYFLVVRELGTSYRRLATTFAVPAIAGLGMGAAVFATGSWLSIAPAFEVAVMVAVGVVSYGVLLFALDRATGYGVVPIVKQMASALG